MKVLMCHSYYRLRGGEDVVFEDECWLLRHHGHEVIEYEIQNDQITSIGKLSLIQKTFWNKEVYREVRELIRRERPHVLHCHNSFPLLSPALYQAAVDENIPVIQTLHNFRLICPGVTLLRDGEICEKCVGRQFALPGVMHRCYQDSLPASILSATMHAYHRRSGNYQRLVSRFIALTQHSRDKFIQAGMPAEQLVVKPNFVRPDPGMQTHKNGYAVFVGRLSSEKGIQTMLDAWKIVGKRLPLRIVGDGPMMAVVEKFAAENGAIEIKGHLSHQETMRQISAANLLVFPSIWYETFGRSVMEAKACGTPVVASGLGAMSELNQDGVTGLLFQPGSAESLAKRCLELIDDPEFAARIGCRGRQQFEELFTADRNIETLLDIYQSAGATDDQVLAAAGETF